MNLLNESKKGGEIMNKKTILSVLVVTVLSASLLGSGKAYAQTSTELPKQDLMTSLIQQLSKRFGLKQDDVQEVFDQVRKDKQTQMEARFEAKLETYVKEGKINEAQKKIIISKHTELQSEMQKDWQSKQNLTPAQRKAEMEKKRQEIESWAKANGIDPQYLGMFFKGGHMKGMGMGMKGWR